MDLFGGGNKLKKTTKSKKTSTTSKAKKTKTSTKTSTKTRSKSKAKGGNFLGAVGDLVAPTGWGSFATAAGLLALDRADAALRRGTKEKKEKMKGGKKMKGGEIKCSKSEGKVVINKNNGGKLDMYQYKLCCNGNNNNNSIENKCEIRQFPNEQPNSEAIFRSMRTNLIRKFENQ